MAFFDYFEKLRQKPRAERKRIATLFAMSITLAILFAWLPFFFYRLESFGEVQKSESSITATFLDSLRDVRFDWPSFAPAPEAELLEAPRVPDAPGTASSSPVSDAATSSDAIEEEGGA
jgi:hypothetical protein